MKLSFNNIGKIGSASVEINGITVVAGENDTGKSTIGKVLFSVFNSCYSIDKEIQNERVKSIDNLLKNLFDTIYDQAFLDVNTIDVAKYIVSKVNALENESQLFYDMILGTIIDCGEDTLQFIDRDKLDDRIERIIDLLKVSEKQIYIGILQNKLDAEFCEQVSNIYSEDNGNIKLIIQNKEINIDIQNNKVIDVDNWLNLRTEAIYIDDPFVVDELSAPLVRMWRYGRGSYELNHRMHLKERLTFSTRKANVLEEIVVNDKFDSIYNKITSVCDGEIIRNKRSSYGYKSANSNKVLDIKNLSTGLKAFVILKNLLLNGSIEQNGTIILDEPEIHLHPEWQLMFAEMIVLLYKQFGMHVLLNTHSPYFLRAIQVYSAKYGVADKCKFYMAETENEMAYISDVSNNVEKIYSKLSKPLQKLESMRWVDD